MPIALVYAGARCCWLAAIALIAAAGVLVPSPAAAQAPELQITVPPLFVAEPATQVRLPIQVGPPGALPGNSFIRLRGVPSTVSLSEGHAVGPGSWAIPLYGLPGLKINIPPGVSGRSEIAISLVAVDGPLLAEAHTALVVGPPAMIAPGERAASAPAAADLLSPPAPVPAGRPDRNTRRPPDLPAELHAELAGELRAQAERLLAQGDAFLRQGSIAPAREVLRRAADMGLAQAALRLAVTYDPEGLARLHARGVVAEVGEARRWYERARELGAPEAEAHLSRLGGG